MNCATLTGNRKSGANCALCVVRRACAVFFINHVIVSQNVVCAMIESN